MAQTTASGIVDLSKLPPPDAVEALDFDTIFARLAADAQARLAGLANPIAFDPSKDADPAVAVLQAAAAEIQRLRQRVNDAIRQVMVASATGSNLDQRLALLDVARLELVPADPETGAAAVMESDDDFRRRGVLAPLGFSVAGPEGAYIFHALSADPDVLDASVTSPSPDDVRAIVMAVLSAQGASAALVTAMTTALDAAKWPGEVDVTILSRTGDGTPTAAVRAAVLSYLTAEERRPLTDFVAVQPAQIVPFAVDATIITYAGPDPAVVRAASAAALDAYLARTRRLGRDVTRSGIFAALHGEGVQRVRLDAPADDVAIGVTQAALCTSITLRGGGTDE